MLTLDDKKEIAFIVDRSIEASFDKFAVIIARRFDDVDDQLNGLQNDILGLQNQINGVNNRLDDVVTNYTRRDEYVKLDKRVTKLEEKIA